MDFIVANLPILLCFLVGGALVVLEAFLPGFGVAGLFGVALEIVSVYFTWKTHGAAAGMGMTLVILLLLTIAIIVSIRSATSGRLSRSKLILSETESSKAGYNAVEDMQAFLGREGVTTTVLRPTGMADFSGEKLNVVSEGEFLSIGQKVKVYRVDGARIVVRPVNE